MRGCDGSMGSKVTHREFREKEQAGLIGTENVGIVSKRKGRWAPDGECLEWQAEEFGCVPSGSGRPFGVRSSMLMEEQ